MYLNVSCNEGDLVQMLMKVGQRIIYPGHGLAIVKEKFKNPGADTIYLKLKFPFVKDMEVMIPEERVESAKIREISTLEEINSATRVLDEAPDKVESYFWHGHKTWKKRQKMYREMIDGGLLTDVARIYKNLWHSSIEKELPFGEKDMMNKVESLFCQEVLAFKDPANVDLATFITKTRARLMASVEGLKKPEKERGAIAAP